MVAAAAGCGVSQGWRSSSSSAHQHRYLFHLLWFQDVCDVLTVLLLLLLLSLQAAGCV
jgi:hypothetical protein